MTEQTNTPELRFPEFKGEWEEKILSQLLEIKSGKVYKETEYTKEGIQLVQGESIDHHKIKKIKTFLPDEYLNNTKNVVLEEGDIVLALNRPIIKDKLKIAKIPKQVAPSILYQRAGKIIYDKSKPDFYLNLFDKHIKDFVMKESIGSDQPFIRTTQLKRKKIFVPGTEMEITKLNNFFSKLDRQIELEEEKLELLEQQKRGYMQKIFSQDLRFKDENGNEYPKWVTQKIKELGNVYTGNTPSKKQSTYWNSNNYIWVTPTDINNKKDLKNSEYMLSDEGFKKARQLPKNTLLITCIASIGKNAILREEGSCNQQINALVPNSDKDVDFLYYAFEKVSKYMKRIAGKTATQIVNKSTFENISIEVPIFEEQLKAGRFLNSFDKLIEKQVSKIELLKQRKQGFLQKMFV
ncbi:restriction endonuclease subunit S [Staphylococcus sp. NRL 16/872]|uniref:restriction endonuclease subunit S n=1 Tax=Staphylococcus sp. NRL 16/872 TaxID=2930131 RepID=UPI001FB47812|nr:restriction endonuclease subunit S [Staphylococcus sp. NRL 16/872]WEN69396.1 restriction endonuclease subunit S [Staphylococcus sp. NRL 16/872]